MDLISKTRPYLTVPQMRIIADDLIYRTQDFNEETKNDRSCSIGYDKEKAFKKPSKKPESVFKFGTPSNNQRVIPARVRNNAISENCNPLVRKRTHNKFCNTCTTVRTENCVNKLICTDSRFSLNSESSPDQKRVRRSCTPQIKKECDSNPPEVKNVFERLYSMRKNKGDSKENNAALAGRKRLPRTSSSVSVISSASNSREKDDLNNSLKKCLGSVQKALDNLKLDTDS